MNGLDQAKQAVLALDHRERRQFMEWLEAAPEFDPVRLERLKEDLAIGLAQADRGESAPLDIAEIKRKGREILAREQAAK